MEAKKINVEEWSYLGAGSTATSYGNKYDGKLFMKLDNKGYPVEATIEELGDKWDSPELNEQIKHAAMIKCCLKLKKDPSAAGYILPLIRGKRLQALIGKCLYSAK